MMQSFLHSHLGSLACSFHAHTFAAHDPHVSCLCTQTSASQSQLVKFNRTHISSLPLTSETAPGPDAQPRLVTARIWRMTVWDPGTVSIARFGADARQIDGRMLHTRTCSFFNIWGMYTSCMYLLHVLLLTCHSRILCRVRNVSGGEFQAGTAA